MGYTCPIGCGQATSNPEPKGAPVDLALLNEFLIVAKCRNISEAARRLFVSQPTLSGHIRLLEKELGCDLLYRGQPLRLTSAGRALVNHGSKLLIEYDALIQTVTDAAASKTEVHIALNTTNTAANLNYSLCINQFATTSSHIEIHEVETSSSNAREALATGEADCVLVEMAPLPVDVEAGLSFMEIEGPFENRLFAYASTESRIGKLDSVSWAELDGVVHPSNTFLFPLWAAAIYAMADSHGARLVMTEDQTEGYGALLSLGDDEIQIFDSAYQTGPPATVPNRCFVPIEGDEARNRAYLVWDPAHTSSALQELLDFIARRQASLPEDRCPRPAQKRP